jgi:hypothetical protein
VSVHLNENGVAVWSVSLWDSSLESRHAARGASKQSVSRRWSVPESESGAVLSIHL